MQIPDITKGNDAIERLLEVTTNPRHRFILMSYARHRFLEFSGHYDDVLADDMMSDHPFYNIQAFGLELEIKSKDEVRAMYRNWAETNQCVFYTEDEQVTVADNFVASKLTVYQQVWKGPLLGTKLLRFLPKGLARYLFIKMLTFRGIKPGLNNMYLCKSQEQWFWSYDDRCRLLREDVFEPDRSTSEVMKLEPHQVLTAARAAELLLPHVKRLPDFDENVLGKKKS
jgi:hypothetical protein